MTVRVYVRNIAGAMEEITDALDVTTLSVTENAEEGSVAISTVTLDDPGMVITMRGHRSFEVLEDEVDYGESGIFRGYVADRTYSRGQFPLGRQVAVQLSDPNTAFTRRVMAGADCDRPAETDVERIQWLITTSEAGTIDDTTYLSTAAPVNMDACDYRAQMMGSVFDDCAQASGKQWYLTHDFVNGDGFQLWYGHETLTAYESTVSLSNLLAEVDGVTVFAIGDETALRIDPSRVFSGAYLSYDGGAVYRNNSATRTAFVQRDTVMPSANVKSRTKAIARALRYLEDLDEEDERITTSTIVRSDQVNLIRPGMRIPFKATHLPGYEQFRWCRVLQRTVAYWTPGWYKLDLELSPGVPSATYTCSTAISGHTVTAYAQAQDTSVSASLAAPADGLMFVMLIVTNRGLPAYPGMTVSAAGWTEMFYAEVESRCSYYLGYREVVTDEVASASATYVHGFEPDPAEAAGMFFLPGTFTVVQQKHNGSDRIYFDATPVPGNIVLMFCKEEGVDQGGATVAGGGPIGGPSAGWTKIWDEGWTASEGGAQATLNVSCFARCVAVGEGTNYDWVATGGYPNNYGTHIIELVVA